MWFRGFYASEAAWLKLLKAIGLGAMAAVAWNWEPSPHLIFMLHGATAQDCSRWRLVMQNYQQIQNYREIKKPFIDEKSRPFSR